MINTEVQKEIIELGIKYENRWGRPVDFIGLPSRLNQKRLLLVMRLIVDTGDSILVGYQKIRDLLSTYYEYLDSIMDIGDGDSVEKKCPLCGKKVRCYIEGNSYEYKCDTPNCIRMTSRGI